MNHESGADRIKTISPSRREIDLGDPPGGRRRGDGDDPRRNTRPRRSWPGFRKGKAPRDLVRGMFLDEIRKDAADALVPKAFEEELKAAGLRPVSVPVIQDAHYEDDGTLHARGGFRCHAGVRTPGLYGDPPRAPGAGRRGQGARSGARGPSPAGRRVRPRRGKGSGRRRLCRRRGPGPRPEDEEGLPARKGRRSRRAAPGTSPS